MTQFTWIPSFTAVSSWLKDYEERQPELISILKEIGISAGLDDQDAAGNIVPLTEIDPFTFFSLFMKYGLEQRQRYFAALLTRIGLKVAAPTDFDGVPSAQPLKVWLFPFIKTRTPDMIKTLWSVYHHARNDTLNDAIFEKALAIPNTGFAKLTECLFYAFPERFFPIDKQTKPFLAKHKIAEPKKNWTSYRSCMESVQRKFSKSFAELSYQAWAENQNEGFSALTAINYLQQRFPGTQRGTVHLVAFLCPNGNELAFDPGENSQEKKSIQVFVNKPPTDLIDVASITEYLASDGRNNHLKQHAPTLSAGNRAWSIKIKSLEQLVQLCDWYSSEAPGYTKSTPQSTSEKKMETQPLNQILYGPPGTGKTYATVELAVQIADPDWYESLMLEPDSVARQRALKDHYDLLSMQQRIVFTTFHQSFAYEDFIEGIRATTNDQTQALSYPIVNGIFKELVVNAEKSTGAGKNLGLSVSPKIWKISIDVRGPSKIRDFCLENGEARIGWNKTGDMSIPDDLDSNPKCITS